MAVIRNDKKFFLMTDLGLMYNRENEMCNLGICFRSFP